MLADWCEDDGRELYATALRRGNAALRVAAVRHLFHWLDDGVEAGFVPSIFTDAIAYFRLLPDTDWLPSSVWKESKDWVALALPIFELSEWGTSDVTLVRAYRGGEGPERLEGVTRLYAGDLLAGEALRRVERSPLLAPFRYTNWRPCAQCSSPSLIVARDTSQKTVAGELVWMTELAALCLRAPHVTELATSRWDYAPV